LLFLLFLLELEAILKIDEGIRYKLGGDGNLPLWE